MVLIDNIITKPATFKETSKREEWVQEMEEELHILKENQTWDLVSQPKEIKPISCKWIGKVKTRPGGSFERYKARLVARLSNIGWAMIKHIVSIKYHNSTSLKCTCT